jgi:Tol biopolymer transport system component
VLVINADGSGLKRLATNPVGGAALACRWDPRGRRLVVFDSEKTIFPLVVIDVATARETLLPDGGGITADWSPDGSRIAFIGRRGVSVAKADGSEPNKLPFLPVAGRLALAWSPDGGSIAVLEANGWSGESAVLSVVRADGSGRRVLATAEPEATAWPGSPWPNVEGSENTRALAVRWSPDGNRLALNFVGDAGHGIFVFDIEKADVRPLTIAHLGYLHRILDWSSDGERLAFLSQSCPLGC